VGKPELHEAEPKNPLIGAYRRRDVNQEHTTSAPTIQRFLRFRRREFLGYHQKSGDAGGWEGALAEIRGSIVPKMKTGRIGMSCATDKNLPAALRHG
jgi:hypothetical protein